MITAYAIKITNPDGRIGWQWSAPGSDYSSCQHHSDVAIPAACIFFTREDAEIRLKHLWIREKEKCRIEIIPVTIHTTTPFDRPLGQFLVALKYLLLSLLSYSPCLCASVVDPSS